MKKYFFSSLPLVIVLLALWQHASVLSWMENQSLDLRFRLRGERALSENIVVVAIDDASVSREGRWPWPREKMAELISKIQRAKWIGLDIVFAEVADGDATLAEAIRQAGNVFLGYYFYTSESEAKAISPEVAQSSRQQIAKNALPSWNAAHDVYEMAGVMANVPVITEAGASQGYFNAFPDSDGTIRRAPLMVGFDGKLFASQALALFSASEGFSPIPVVRSEKTVGLAVGERYVPMDAHGEILVNYRGRAVPIVSATDILTGSAPTLSGKTVLVGATAVGIYDLRVTPLSANTPGIFIEANVLDMLQRGDFLVPVLPAVNWAIIIVGALILLTGLGRGKLAAGILGVVLLVGCYGVLAHYLFVTGRVVMMATPIVTWMGIAAVMISYRALTEERQKRFIRNAFRHYLHPDIIEQFISNPERLRLGGERMECTILFSDMVNFSGISEKMSPEDVVEMMNAVLEPLSEAIVSEGGYIDKYIGDAVMAVFGAPQPNPQHARQACQAALKMQQVVRDMQAEIARRFSVPNVSIRIGIHTGPVLIGNMGGRSRMNYTVMGDAVNLASRLEGANKEMHTQILISEATYLHAHMDARYVDEITVKGKAERIKVYELSTGYLTTPRLA